MDPIVPHRQKGTLTLMFRDKNTVRFHLAMWAGHWAPVILIVSMVYSTITAVYGRIVEDSIFDTTAAGILSAVMTAVMFISLYVESAVHDVNLCVKELDRAPLADPQTAVDESMGWLRMRHTLRPLLWAGASLLSWIFVGLILIKWENFLTLTAYVIVGVWLLVATSSLSYSRLVHRRLGPWCPWCQWGRGPDDDDDPPPAPTGPTTDARTDAH